MRTIQLNEYKDFKYALEGLRSDNFTEVTDGQTIPSNSYAWNEDYKALRVNNGTSDKKGAINIKGFPSLNIGDTVEVYAEVMNVSGVKAKMALDYIENGVSNLFILQSAKTGQEGFEVLSGRFTITQKRRFEIVIGTFTPDIGDYYVRNVVIKVNSQNNKAFMPDIRAYTLLAGANATEFSLTGFHPFKCSISSTSEYVEITHEDSFGGVSLGGGRGTLYHGTGIATVSATGIDNIIAKVNGETTNRLRVHFYDVITGEKVAPINLISSPSNVYVGVIHFAYR